jgi:outer membrane protein OmpA-like peptidoglycan-associated protein
MTKTRQLTALLSAALLAAAPLAARAQAPSSDSILNSLTPGVGHGGGTRGLRPGAPMTATPAPDSSAPTPRVSAGRPVSPTTPRAQPPVVADQAPSANLTVQFRTGSADLTPDAIKTLDALGMALTNSKIAGSRFRIEGHTDTVGSPDANKGLSERRADTVVSYLVAHFNIDRAKLEAVGMGETGLLVPTGSGVAEPRNRRVLVVNLGA